MTMLEMILKDGIFVQSLLGTGILVMKILFCSTKYFQHGGLNRGEFWDLYGRIIRSSGKRKAPERLNRLVKENGASYLLASPLGARYFTDEELWSIVENFERSKFWIYYATGVGEYERFKVQRNASTKNFSD